MEPHQLSRTQARRIAVQAQLLDAPLRDDLLDVVRHLTLVQVEPTAAVAPSADLVMWSRLGAAYHPGDLDAAHLRGSLVELRARLRPAPDIALYRAEMAAWPGVGEQLKWQTDQRDWVLANDDCRRDILQVLYDDGPLPSIALPDTTLVPWASSGWTNDRNVRTLLDLMVQRGEVARAGYDGRTPLWDLAERVYPDEPAVPLREANRIRAVRTLRALGIARSRTVRLKDELEQVGSVGEPAVIDGVRGTWRVDPAYLDRPFKGRTVLLSPLDRLVFDRKRMAEIFQFDYQLEMYKPASTRRWGYWALPILHGDRLVGKVDATTDRKAGELRINAIHEDVPFSKTLATKVRTQLRSLTDWLDVDLARLG
ncbi:DNA glycosylase AlkZ-like family protein [Leekyejoonella antrihumi]|uniref:Winged helix-turn-helix domain-containing protein n=1 Tax=Leekyejoonella antrihumi TaxID=1660198 RepID=A0A563DXH0_9MICO|nr:crosslink repair DNA glycosylase YcaQ family protein [Leekyejoonella antrihumi]TWP34988.1 winged helix-turn-helix domain-containing protein [Leekyejoonella antrihumi]